MSTHPVLKHEKALLVQALIGKRSRADAADSLHELGRLADTAGIEPVGSLTQRRERPDAGFFIGHGKLAEIQLASREAGADLVIFDNDLSPIQADNLKRALGCQILDRTELILRIFARRAQTAEAQLQVELAQTQYLVARLPRSARQHRFHGGIGARGPGESPSHLHRAPMLARITWLKRRLREIQKRRLRIRARRRWPLVCLVGYTNAGKSTLLNAMTAANAYVDDRLFATLDTTHRRMQLPDGRALMLVDTVGFIRHLPHGLVASFRATLEEIKEADLLLVVADAGHAYLPEHLAVVETTLADMQAHQIPRLLLLNKSDTLPDEPARTALLTQYPHALLISAATRTGLDRLRVMLAERLPLFAGTDRPTANPG